MCVIGREIGRCETERTGEIGSEIERSGERGRSETERSGEIGNETERAGSGRAGE